QLDLRYLHYFPTRRSSDLARGAGTEAGDPGRNRFGPGHRRAQARGRRGQRPALARARVRGDHPLPAPARVHPSRRGPRAGGRPDRRIRRPRTEPAAGGARLRLDRRAAGAGGGGVPSPLLQSLASGFSGDDARRALLEAALRDGLPGPRSDRWKYTPLRALDRRSFGTPGPATIDAALLDGIPAPRLVFVNGGFDAALSRLDA